MPKFPKSENEVVALAQSVASRLDANAVVFPASPVTFEMINDKIASLFAARDTMTAAQAASVIATTNKNAIFTDLADSIKQVLRYAENIPGYENAQMSMLGWSDRRDHTPTEAPSNPPLPTVTNEGLGDISLSWKKPVTGGKPATYLVERREQGTETWNLEMVSINRAVTLTEQPRGQSLEYRIVSMNRAGTSVGSNAVAVVL